MNTVLSGFAGCGCQMISGFMWANSLELLCRYWDNRMTTLIAKFVGPIWGPSGAERTQVGPCWPHELCYLGTPTVTVHVRVAHRWRMWVKSSGCNPQQIPKCFDDITNNQFCGTNTSFIFVNLFLMIRPCLCISYNVAKCTGNKFPNLFSKSIFCNVTNNAIIINCPCSPGFVKYYWRVWVIDNSLSPIKR